MYRVKTFTQELKIFKTMSELTALDDEVNKFFKSEKIKKVVSVCDSPTISEGNTIGLIRTVTYEC